MCVCNLGYTAKAAVMRKIAIIGTFETWNWHIGRFTDGLLHRYAMYVSGHVILKAFSTFINTRVSLHVCMYWA